MSSKTYIPEHYAPLLNLYDTQKAISLLRRVFEDTLCGNLQDLTKEQEADQAALEEKMERWLYLTDLAERIAAQEG